MDPARLHAPAARDILAVLQVATWRAVPFIVLAQWRVSGDGEQFAVTFVVQVNCGAPSTCLLLDAHCRLTEAPGRLRLQINRRQSIRLPPTIDLATTVAGTGSMVRPRSTVQPCT